MNSATATPKKNCRSAFTECSSMSSSNEEQLSVCVRAEVSYATASLLLFYAHVHAALFWIHGYMESAVVTTRGRQRQGYTENSKRYRRKTKTDIKKRFRQI